MTSRTLVYFGAAVAAWSVRADPAGDAVAAAMKLSTVQNYTWSEQITQNGAPLEMRGKTSDNGYSQVTFVGYNGPTSPSHGVSTSGVSTASTNAIFLGDNKYVVETTSGWIVPNATATTDANPTQGNRSGINSNRSPRSGGGGTRGGAGGIGGMGGRRGGMGRGGGQGRSSGGETNSQTTSASGNPRLPSGINLPHEELAVIAANYTELKVENGVYTGKLTQSGADLMFVPPGSSTPPPNNAAGTFRLWIKDGVVTKYEIKLTADTPPGRPAAHNKYSETRTIDLTEIGSTRVDIPPEAKRKLSA